MVPLLEDIWIFRGLHLQFQWSTASRGRQEWVATPTAPSRSWRVVTLSNYCHRCHLIFGSLHKVSNFLGYLADTSGHVKRSKTWQLQNAMGPAARLGKGCSFAVTSHVELAPGGDFPTSTPWIPAFNAGRTWEDCEKTKCDPVMSCGSL